MTHTDNAAAARKTAPFILCRDLFKIYKIADLEVVALRGLDLKVERGEIVAIVGASGSGKSTLLNILAGYDTPSAGTVRIGDRDFINMGARDLEIYRRHEVGFVWQQTSRNLFPYLSALENVALPMMLTSLGAAERDERARTLLDLVGLADRAGHTPETLSGGEQQRVAIGVALANHPALLLADEPTGELDDATAAEVFAVFDVVSKELKTTVVIVSHDQEIAQKVPRVVIIQDGKLSTEVRRAASFRRPGDGELREFTFVDPTGRLQIPREFLEQLNISERAKVFLEGDQLRIVRVDFDE